MCASALPGGLYDLPGISPASGKVVIHRYEGPSLVLPSSAPASSQTFYSQLMYLLPVASSWSPTPTLFPNFVVAMDAQVGSSASVRVCHSTAPGQCLP